MNNQTDNSIINAVKRLERAGSEHSRATEKLCEAAIRTLNFLYDTVPSDFYGTVTLNNSKTVDVSLRWHEEEHRDLYRGYTLHIEGLNKWRRNSYEQKPDEKYRDVDRWEALQLAEYLANGFLTALEREMDADRERAESATAQIENK